MFLFGRALPAFDAIFQVEEQRRNRQTPHCTGGTLPPAGCWVGSLKIPIPPWMCSKSASVRSRRAGDVEDTDCWDGWAVEVRWCWEGFFMAQRSFWDRTSTGLCFPSVYAAPGARAVN